MCRWNLCFWQADTGAVKALIGWELARARAEAAYLQHIVSFHVTLSMRLTRCWMQICFGRRGQFAFEWSSWGH